MHYMGLKNFVLFSMLTMGMAGTALAYSENHPVGTLKYDPAKTYNGYTLLDTLEGKNTYTKLIDMNGNEVHRWVNTKGMPSKMLPGGQIMTAVGSWKNGSQDQISLQQQDWDGKVLWEFHRLQAVNPFEGAVVENGKSWVARQHHDYQRQGMSWYYSPIDKPTDPLAKGNTLILGHRNMQNDRVNSQYRLIDDIVYEVSWDGKIVWDYTVSEHLDDYGFTEAAYKAMQSYPPADNPRAQRTAAAASKSEGGGFDWFHVNALSYVGPNKWFDQGDKRFNPNNILLNSRETNIFAIIDRDTKKVVWRVGPDYSAGSPDAKIGQIVGPHATHIIPRGLPGEGNILMFDNGGLGGYGEPNINSPTGYLNARRDHSRVLEINPLTKEIVWQYTYALTSKRPADHFAFHFYSPFTSIPQRLPNGNTVITEGDTGRIFEVTPQLEIVWEYNLPEATQTGMILYRSYRVPYDWVPQLPKPVESAVVPPAPFTFVLPNVDGVYPKVMGVNSSISTVVPATPAASTAPTAPTAPVVDAEEDDNPVGMHSY